MTPEYDKGNNDRSDSEHRESLEDGQTDGEESENKDEGALEEDNLLQEEEYQDDLPGNLLETEQNILELPNEMEIDDVNIEDTNQATNGDEEVEEEMEEHGASSHEENTQSDAEGQNSEDIFDTPVDEINAKAEKSSTESNAREYKDKIDDVGTTDRDGSQSLVDQK